MTQSPLTNRFVCTGILRERHPDIPTLEGKLVSRLDLDVPGLGEDPWQQITVQIYHDLREPLPVLKPGEWVRAEGSLSLMAQPDKNGRPMICASIPNAVISIDSEAVSG